MFLYIVQHNFLLPIRYYFNKNVGKEITLCLKHTTTETKNISFKKFKRKQKKIYLNKIRSI